MAKCTASMQICIKIKLQEQGTLMTQVVPIMQTPSAIHPIITISKNMEQKLRTIIIR